MNLIEVSVRADGEAAEAVSELFNRVGRGGAVIEERHDGEPHQVVVRTYLLCDDQIDANRRTVEESLWHLAQLYPIPPAAFRELKDDDWANAWKSFHPVQHVGARIVLKPTWREYVAQPHELVIELDPGMAFGTGQHPSTRFCLLAIERHMRAGMRVLDVGTGSGILSILAAKLGACDIFACDIDPVAIDVARENIALNHVGEQIRLGIGSLGSGDASTALHPVPRASARNAGERLRHRTGTGLEVGIWDLLIINILAPIIIQLLPLARPLLSPSGRIILSGLIATQEDDVRAAMAAVGLRVVEREQEGDWVMLTGQVVS
ncbi:MAG: 50S ribosomal protein L11 methyltransferase [Chloroflexota bacterium]